MHLATIKIHDTVVLSLQYARIDADVGAAIVELIGVSVQRGARRVVLDLGPHTVIDFAGARAIEAASDRLERGESLILVGLNGRARALLRSVRVLEKVRLVEWWTDAVEPMTRAA